MPKPCRKRAAGRQRGWGPGDRSGVDTGMPNPAGIEGTEPKDTLDMSLFIVII